MIHLPLLLWLTVILLHGWWRVLHARKEVRGVTTITVGTISVAVGDYVELHDGQGNVVIRRVAAVDNTTITVEPTKTWKSRLFWAAIGFFGTMWWGPGFLAAGFATFLILVAMGVVRWKK